MRPALRPTMCCRSGTLVELRALHNTKTVAKCNFSNCPGARRRANERVNGGRSILIERAAGPFANHNIQLVIFHRRIEYSSTTGEKPVNSINKRTTAWFVYEHSRQIARFFQHRARRGSEIDAHSLANDIRQSQLYLTSAGPKISSDSVRRHVQFLCRLECKDLHLGALTCGWPTYSANNFGRMADGRRLL